MLEVVEKKLNLRKFLDVFVVKVNPNYVSLLALLAAVAVGYFFYQYQILLAGLFVLLNGFLDIMDGQIAKKYGVTKYGDFLDHTFDRLADVVIFTGIAFSGIIPKEVGFGTIIAILLVSYMGTQAQALSNKRLYSGLLGRADRLALLIIASFLTPFYSSALFYAVWAIFILSVLTFLHRFILSKKLITS